MNLPPGFRFLPTDQELILYYLKPKANNQPVPQNDRIVERNLYGDHANPWNVLRDNDPWDIPMIQDKDQTKRSLYVFTKLVKYGKNRTERGAGYGKWDGQTRVPIINNVNGETIGCRRMLSFEAKKNPDAVKKNHGHWIMHEYSLDGSVNEHTSNDYVICKITRTCPHANKKEKVQGPSMDDMREEDIFSELGDIMDLGCSPMKF